MAVNDVDLDQLISSVDTAQAGSQPLDRVTAAREVAARLEACAQHLVAHFVDDARRAGASWTDIGAALGVTRQAAQQRFVPAEGVDVEAAAGRSGLPYSARATAVLGGARDLALQHRHPGVDDIHLLLALLDNRSGGAVSILKSSGQRSADIRRTARAKLGTDGPKRSAKNPHLGRGGAKTLDVAEREALRRGSTEVGTEHLLLALVSDPGSPAGTALAEAGVAPADVRREAAKQAKSDPAPRRARRKRS